MIDRLPRLPVRRTTLAAIACVVLAIAAVPAGADVVTVQSDAPSVSGNGGTTATLTTSAPVAGPGAVAQELVQSWDPDRLRLTGASGVIAPSGWTLSYSSDGTTFGSAPGTPAGWAAVRAVKATGSITSGGNSAGFQIVEGTGTGTVPPSSPFSSAGGGDGWDVSFDDDGHVFNVFHHDGAWNGSPGFSTPGIDCHTRSGASCGPGWPFLLRVPHGQTGPGGIAGQPWYHTNEQSMSWVDTTNQRIWVPTNLNDGTSASGTGFVCVDISDLAVGPAWCGGGIVNAFVKLGPTVCGRDCALGLAAAGGYLFAWDASTGDLICLDPSATRAGDLPGAGCPGQPFSFTGIATASLADGYALGATQGGLVFGSASGKAVCFDPATLVACAGWSSGPATLTGTYPTMMVEAPAPDGSAGAVCFTRYDLDRGCFAGDGTSSTQLTGSHAGAALMTYIAGKVVQIAPKTAAVAGSRVYWANGAWYGGGSIYCFDTSLNAGAGAACANWPVAVSAYTATIDAQNVNCIWTNTDSGAITTIDAITGGSTCVTPPATATLSTPVMIPRLACSGANAIRSWQSFQLAGPSASTYSTGTFTVLTAAGRTVSGWNRVPIPAGTRTIDLSGLSVAASGQAPQFRISLADKTTSDPIQGRVVAVGDAPQLCVPLVTQAICPTITAQYPNGAPTPTPTAVAGDGTVQYASNPPQAFTRGSASIAVTAPSDATCLGTISGTATMASGGSVAGAPVRLLDPAGAEIASTVTDPSGAYAFEKLAAVSGYRVEFGPAAAAAASAATDAGASTARSVTANTATTVNGTYETLWTDPLVGTGTSGSPVGVVPSPTTSTGATAQYAAFTAASTCVIDPADATCKASVVVPGEGTWAVDAASGAITFTSLPSFAGAATAVRYRVTETATGRTTWNSVRMTISAPPPAPVAPATTPASTTRGARPALRVSAPARVAATGVIQVVVTTTGPGTITQRGFLPAGAPACSYRRVVGAATRVITRCAIDPPVGSGAVRVRIVTRFRAMDGTVTTTTRYVRVARVAGPSAVTG